MVSLECATWELTNLLQFITSVYCARWMSQGFGFPKLLTRKRRLLSILFKIYGLQEQMGDTDFSENEWTFGYCIQIFKDFHPGFHWVSKHMHVMWYTSSDL